MTISERNIWRYLFFASIILCLVLLAFLISQTHKANEKKSSAEFDFKQRYAALKVSYITLAKQYISDLDVLVRNEQGVSKYWEEYQNAPEGAFGENTRRKIMRLEIELENLERENLPPNSLGMPTSKQSEQSAGGK